MKQHSSCLFSGNVNNAIDGAGKEIKALEGKLKNKGFLANAPEAVVLEAKERLDAELAAKAKLEAALARLT